MRRKLTQEEKREIAEAHVAREQARHPGVRVHAIVADETDEAGKPIVRVSRE